jgi:hypothetical protein
MLFAWHAWAVGKPKSMAIGANQTLGGEIAYNRLLKFSPEKSARKFFERSRLGRGYSSMGGVITDD